MPSIRVVAFARLREVLGASRQIALADGATVRELWAALVESEPRLQGLDGGLRFACNERLCDTGQVLREGDEVALLPPYGGG